MDKRMKNSSLYGFNSFSFNTPEIELTPGITHNISIM